MNVIYLKNVDSLKLTAENNGICILICIWNRWELH